jgi:hypothetical protein
MNYNKGLKLVISFCTLLFCGAPKVQASQSEGRFSFGAYVSKEQFKQSELGSDRNDYLIGSSRIFYRVWDMGEDKWEWTLDLRDNHDFYDKLDAENMRLTDRNSFQVRQLFTRWLNPNGRWSSYLGRFPYLEGGDIYVDGAGLEYRWTKDWKSAVFGGLNPKTTDQTYLHFNNNTAISGVSLTYQQKSSDWNRNLYLSHALVSETVDGLQDRYYFFHQMNYQWDVNSRLISIFYVDFVPRTYIQIGNVIFQLPLSQRTAVEMDLLGIDTIEYTRRQGVREILPSSPYQEARLRLSFKLQPLTTFSVEALTGHRSADDKKKTEASFGWVQNKLFTKYWDFYAKVGGRKNFVSDDVFLRSGFGYFSNAWESSLDAEYASEKYEDGHSLHPLTVDLAISCYLAQSLYLTLTLERATDETVDIMSAFFKVGYRFGSREVPPIRDGAPPRGPL